MNSYTMETIARQQFAATARHAEAVGSRSGSTTSRRRWTRVSFQFPTIVHVKEAR